MRLASAISADNLAAIARFAGLGQQLSLCAAIQRLARHFRRRRAATSTKAHPPAAASGVRLVAPLTRSMSVSDSRSGRTPAHGRSGISSLPEATSSR
jgi:hypothetical protein